MSSASSKDSRFGPSTWLQFLELPQLPRNSASQTSAPAVPYLSLVESVSVWAAETPDAAAATTVTETLSYAELDAQSNALARHLQSLGATSETLVALVLDRSADFLIAALATWKTGAAYLPLDPSSPPRTPSPHSGRRPRPDFAPQRSAFTD